MEDCQEQFRHLWRDLRNNKKPVQPLSIWRHKNEKKNSIKSFCKDLRLERSRQVREQKGYYYRLLQGYQSKCIQRDHTVFPMIKKLKVLILGMTRIKD